jgi:NADH dehydrogenase [ubiquinone] 1 alpha subcomplex assembly factor 6
MVIPAEITSKHGVVQEEVFRQGSQAPGIEDAVFEFATLAHDHLKTARSMLLEMEGSNGKAPKEALPVFLAGVCAINILTSGTPDKLWNIGVVIQFRYRCQIISDV